VAARPIRVEPLRELSVIGQLNLPLGTVTDVGATIISGEELNDKAHQSAYLLRVSRIGGRVLDKPMVMEFEVPSFISVDLANDVFDLYELKHGERIGSLQPEQIKEIEQGYVGRTVQLIVYETGSFSGVPMNLPPDFVTWQDRMFGFSTRLVVLAERP
jgi:hypothetical protein